MDRSNNQMPSNSLFRQEVLNEKHRSHMGQVLIHQSSSYVWIALVALILVFLVIAFLFLGTHTRTVNAPGLLVPNQGVLRVLAPAPGLVVDVKVSEGQLVEQGDPLFIIADERVSSAGKLQSLVADKLKLRTSLIQQDKEQATTSLNNQQVLLKQRLSAIERKDALLEIEVDILEQRVQLSNQSYSRLQTLHDQGHIADFELQNAQAERLVLASQKQALVRVQSDLESDRLILMADHQNQQELYLRQKIEFDQKLALLQQEIAENNVRSNQIVQAPFTGKVTGLNVQSGQQVTINSLMASLIPHNSKLQADLYITPSQVGFIEKNQVVSLRYAAYPYQKFGTAQGRIITISSSPYSLKELPTHISSFLQSNISAQSQGQNYYRVSVELKKQDINIHGSSHSLLPGMQLESDIKQDERKVYEWILDPIYSISKM